MYEVLIIAITFCLVASNKNGEKEFNFLYQRASGDERILDRKCNNAEIINDKINYCNMIKKVLKSKLKFKS